MHPLPALMNNGVPVVLCSDDPAAFGNMGLTYDYFQVLVASEITGLSTLAALARDSIEVSCRGSGTDKLLLNSISILRLTEMRKRVCFGPLSRDGLIL